MLLLLIVALEGKILSVIPEMHRRHGQWSWEVMAGPS